MWLAHAWDRGMSRAIFKVGPVQNLSRMCGSMQEEGSGAEEADVPDGARLCLEVAAAKDSTLPRRRVGPDFALLADPTLAVAAPPSAATDHPLPDPSSDHLLRRRLPGMVFAAAGAAADAAAEKAVRGMHADAVAAAQRALRGPGRYDPPAWLMVCASHVSHRHEWCMLHMHACMLSACSRGGC